jgi:hypothetical protein
MACLDADALLVLVKEMSEELSRYLAGSVGPAEAIPRILATCKRLRATELDEGMRYWLGAIERHAAGLGSPRGGSDDERWLFSSSEFLRVHLMRDISFLRLQIVNARSAANGAAAHLA